MKNEFLCYYKSVFDDKKNLVNININEINIYIFDSLAYNNIIFNNLYSDLLYNLILINSDFSNILINNLNIFHNIFKYLKIPNSSNNFTEINEINKNNDKYKCLYLFYSYCIKLNMVSLDTIINGIINLQEELIINIKLENKKEYNELLTQFLVLIASNFKLSICLEIKFN